MKLKMIFALIFLAAGAVCLSPVGTFAQQQEEAKPPIKNSRSFMSGSYAYKFTEQEFAGAPLWNQDGEPPLSMARAIRTARENLPRFVKNAELWKLNAVMLENMGDDIWYYRVHLYCNDRACRDFEDRSFTSLVKMDGNIIEPKKVPVEK